MTPTNRQYAARTKVTKTATRGELETLLQRHGATSVISGVHDGAATIAFQVAGLRILMRVPLPDINEERFTRTPTGKPRDADLIHAEHQAAIRATWRALLLFVKAKLVGVDQGLTTIEREFLPHILLPDGNTLADIALPEITAAYQNGQVPELIAGTHRRALGPGK